MEGNGLLMYWILCMVCMYRGDSMVITIIFRYVEAFVRLLIPRENFFFVLGPQSIVPGTESFYSMVEKSRRLILIFVVELGLMIVRYDAASPPSPCRSGNHGGDCARVRCC